MRARDIMSNRVISVAPETSILQAAALMIGSRINAAPVISGNALVGIVSETDLLHRYETGSQRHSVTHPWWPAIFGGDGASWSYVEAHAMKVLDVMTPRVVTIEEDTPISDIAALFEKYKIRQAPVLRAQVVVGVVTRLDFLRALVARAILDCDDDAAIRHALLAELESQPWWDPMRCAVAVSGGVVRYNGTYDNPEEKLAARMAAENIPGVRSVQDDRLDSTPASTCLAGGNM